MQVEEFYWERPKRARLYGRMWLPQQSMTGLVIMIHGVGEHSGCYEQWAQKFVNESIGFLAFDLRGHGKSTGKRGHASYKAIKDDLRWVIKTMRKKFPQTPLILYGHSMGGNIVLEYALSRGVNVQGIIASSPWLKLVNPPSPIIMRVAKFVAKIFPSFTVRTGVRSEELGNTEAAGKSTKKDPLLHKKISVKLFMDIWNNGEWIMRNKHKINTPLLLMHGSLDQLTSCKATQSFARHSGPNTKFKQWRGMFHDLYNDPNNEIVFQYVVSWISRTIEKYGVVQNDSKRKLYKVA